MKNLPPRQMFRQFLALRAVLLASAPGRWLHRLDLGGHGRQVAVQCFLQQASLLGVVTLALGGELQPLECGHLMGELVDDGLFEDQLGTRSTQCLAQLLRIQAVEVIGDHGG